MSSADRGSDAGRSKEALAHAEPRASRAARNVANLCRDAADNADALAAELASLHAERDRLLDEIRALRAKGREA